MMDSAVMFLGWIMLPRFSRSMIVSMEIRFVFVMTFADWLHCWANRDRKMFSSSMPVRVTKDSQVSMPSSIRMSWSVPSPLMMMALGRFWESHSQRLRSFSMILTPIP